MTAAVDVRGVHKLYGPLHVLHGVDLVVEPGEVVCLIGPSGSGKSTLLRCINNLEKIQAGIIHVNGELVGYRWVGHDLVEATPRQTRMARRNIGMVFQQFNLFGHLTVLQNIIEAPIHVLGTPRAKAVERAKTLLARVGLADKHADYPAQLSGGQQQRVAIARALCMQPKLMLFDEPTSALDPELVGEVLDVLRDLARNEMTMVIVTHEIGFARQVADTVVFMDQGRIVEHGPAAQVLDSPRHERTRRFLERVS
ncbi:ectoine/hydroxyectoine ABC transporter ATP-binding protein EhuA [Actinosynnema sp. ALI-1.44]|uniref:amino acid ABC transporter ATP-binding protein n=1 Tax=Actinosynnema sp. ALI-1.44 TaxID=1933779 RepID=UPI00097CAB64|nr:amino acid ABC transporter ATP-binding protein [Actinosynnema sp. ALI-1.44]ONI85870.1 ectoine/hydroxyectoine ABC transporter ATP-binding protein EhuA [Actinosynnema sp. ALI-1.44]